MPDQPAPMSRVLLEPPRPEPPFALPEGAYRDADGRLWHRLYRHRGFFDADDVRLRTAEDVREARRQGKPVYEDHDPVPRPCLVPPPWATPEQVEALRREARADKKDFWHPVHGWLSWGRKRMQEAPENMGAGIARQRRRQLVPPPEEVVETVVELPESLAASSDDARGQQTTPGDGERKLPLVVPRTTRERTPVGSREER